MKKTPSGTGDTGAVLHMYARTRPTRFVPDRKPGEKLVSGECYFGLSGNPNYIFITVITGIAAIWAYNSKEYDIF